MVPTPESQEFRIMVLIFNNFLQIEIKKRECLLKRPAFTTLRYEIFYLLDAKVMTDQCWVNARMTHCTNGRAAGSTTLTLLTDKGDRGSFLTPGG